MSPCCCSGERDLESDVLVAIYEHIGEKIQLSELAEELCINEDELRSIIVKLSAKTTVRLVFDRNTGELVIGEPKEAEKTEETEGTCAYCSYPLPEGAHYCPSCGSSVE
jgi:hypothetical protein